MSAAGNQQTARELRQRAERHRLLAKQIGDDRAAQALRCAAAKEAAEAAAIERSGDA